MRPTTTYPDVLEFLPKAAEQAAGRGGAALAKVRIVLGALGDGLSGRPRLPGADGARHGARLGGAACVRRPLRGALSRYPD